MCARDEREASRDLRAPPRRSRAAQRDAARRRRSHDARCGRHTRALCAGPGTESRSERERSAGEAHGGMHGACAPAWGLQPRERSTTATRRTMTCGSGGAGRCSRWAWRSRWRLRASPWRSLTTTGMPAGDGHGKGGRHGDDGDEPRRWGRRKGRAASTGWRGKGNGGGSVRSAMRPWWTRSARPSMRVPLRRHRRRQRRRRALEEPRQVRPLRRACGARRGCGRRA